ncbi:conjugal transfer protein [Desulfomicrobium sp. ZS1]|jgi:hypothetical protein|uniref:conjugal transfer protein n=1 Tax=Desulfomicrobium sp. ZS1 TaxID=2952228 RepID=UPI0020B2C436|nr:conjugal transfer protein [Desulfomicrobium sp. ZS1]UTF49898.1 conjugal transfer protein [Desulfomicrobium sp. ZS1]
MRERVEWSIQVPIFRNPVILKQLGLAIGIPFGLIFVIMLASGASIADLRYPAILIGLLFFLTWLFIRIVWGGKYDAEFVIDGKGIRCRTAARQAKQNRIINGLTVVLGLLSGKPAAAGAGILAQSRQDVLVKWGSVKKIKELPHSNTIMVYGGFAQNIAVFCIPENYQQVREYITSKIRPGN